MTIRVLCLVAEETRREDVAGALSAPDVEGAIVGDADLDAALSRLESGSFDGIVVGHDEPALDAVAACERLRERHPSLPVIVAPRDGSETLASDVLGAGGTDYVRRADTDEELAERIDRAVDQPRAQRDGECCAILDALEDAIVVYDPTDGSVVDVNERVRTLVGCRPEADCAVSLSALRDKDADDETVRSILQRTLESGSRTVEWHCETPSGEQFWAEITFNRVERVGDPLVVARCTDVSERKRRVQQLRSFRKAVERAGHSIYITDPDGTIRYVNPAFEDVTGYSAAMAVGATPRLLKSGVHDEAFYRDLWSTILAGDVWEDQLVNRRKDGDEYIVNQTIAPITDENGEVVNFVAVNADITEQKRRESRLRRLHEMVTDWLEASTREDVAAEAAAHLEDLLDLELNGVFLYDDSSDTLRSAGVSETAAEVVDSQPQFGEDDSIAWRVFDSGEAEIHDDVRETATVYNPETPIRSEIALPLGDHGVLLVGSRTVAAFDETDVMLARIVASSLEATLDRINRERELEREKERFEQFASVVSHDLRNPLTVAMGELERARETGDSDAFEGVVRSHERIADIIDDLLWLAREGKAIDDPQPVLLAHIAARAWENIDAPGVSLELACDRHVMADPGRLQQLLENLFRNAVEHGQETRDGDDTAQSRLEPTAGDATDRSLGQQSTAASTADELTIRVGVTDDGFYVADTGVGIPESERENILETGYTTADDGTGLGLSIVTTIVDSHGWDLGITESVEGGARFEIDAAFADGDSWQ